MKPKMITRVGFWFRFPDPSSLETMPKDLSATSDRFCKCTAGTPRVVWSLGLGLAPIMLQCPWLKFSGQGQ